MPADAALSAQVRGALDAQVRDALDAVLDPCSIGRGVPSGLNDMGMVVRSDIERGTDGRTRLELELRMTAPACTFQLYFDQQVRARLALIPGLDTVDIAWSERFDWSDDDMSAALKQRLRAKRSRLELTLRAARSADGAS